MFKYLWIVILVLLVGSFVGYTTVCIYKSYEDALDYFERRDMKDVSIVMIISRTWYEFTCSYDVLCGIWVCVFVVGVILLFVLSLCSYLPEPPAE